MKFFSNWWIFCFVFRSNITSFWNKIIWFDFCTRVIKLIAVKAHSQWISSNCLKVFSQSTSHKEKIRSHFPMKQKFKASINLSLLRKSLFKLLTFMSHLISSFCDASTFHNDSFLSRSLLFDFHGFRNVWSKNKLVLRLYLISIIIHKQLPLSTQFKFIHISWLSQEAYTLFKCDSNRIEWQIMFIEFEVFDHSHLLSSNIVHIRTSHFFHISQIDLSQWDRIHHSYYNKMLWRSLINIFYDSICNF